MPASVQVPAAISVSTPASAGPRRRPALADLLTPDRIVIFDDPVSREQLLRRLLDAIARSVPQLDVEATYSRLMEREHQGSTFLNEGVALPHARIEGLASPQVALGLTHGGVLDAPADIPIEAVFLLLSPGDGAAAHLQLLAAAGRSLQNRELRRSLRRVATPPQAFEAISR
jgi:mannitol/fructose-specific phosphotransferase system IIA component (Ntr-type)